MNWTLIVYSFVVLQVGMAYQRSITRRHRKASALNADITPPMLNGKPMPWVWQDGCFKAENATGVTVAVYPVSTW